ncbi:MAG: hypothetical protein JSV27_11300 [Candidatus Bathyarchaeota archaeon]|nr:MAG: hypothetical protein JSV27_11300 [Candidatus Bathyarchaeota archaeon]
MSECCAQTEYQTWKRDSEQTLIELPPALGFGEDITLANGNVVLLSDETMKYLEALNRVILIEEDRVLSLGETVARVLDFYRRFVRFA